MDINRLKNAQNNCKCSIVLALQPFSAMSYRIKDIVAILGCRGQIVSQDQIIEHLLTDSRNITLGERAIFIAISGKYHDGHLYIDDAYNAGVRAFLVEKIPLNTYPDANFLIVEDSLAALQALAAYHRSNFKIPVVGITGSNGKTIVKEWLNHLLKIDFDIIRSPKSYNSQLGVPLSVWGLDKQHELAIFEAGISLPGEMMRLEKIIKPTIGIITNILSAHNEGFDSEYQKTIEKLKLFSGCDKIIYCKDHVALHAILEGNNNCVSWSVNESNDADIKVSDIEQLADKTLFTLNYKENPYHFAIPFADNASIENAIHTLIAAIYLLELTHNLNNESIERITTQAMELPVISMRLELKKGINNCTLINDAYSADIASLAIALRFMHHHANGLNKTVIISDFDESGEKEIDLYKRVVDLLTAHDIKTIYGIGKAFINNQAMFKSFTTYPFVDTDSFLTQFGNYTFENEIILVKGARRFQLEKIGNLLTLKTHGTVLRINLNNLSHNLNVYRSLLNKGVKTMAMVKAFSYGSGQAEIARLLANQRVDYLAVAYADEGADLRRQGIRLPIMVMNPEPETFDQLKQYHLEPEIYSIDILNTFIQTIGKSSSTIHLKFDTGMHRLGFKLNDVDSLIAILNNNNQIKIASIFSHLAGADEMKHDAFSQQQIELFQTICDKITHSIGYQPLRHILNSPGISRFKNAQLDMVRLGIGLYGVDPSAVLQNKLLPVGILQTNIAQIHDIKPGDSIGYSRTFIADKNMRTATINIGYADGFSRRMSNGIGKVWINGKVATVIGRVCMDMCMIDITSIADAKVGDRVELFGEHISIVEYAAAQETIPYEVMTGISQRVKRVYEVE